MYKLCPVLVGSRVVELKYHEISVELKYHGISVELKYHGISVELKYHGISGECLSSVSGPGRFLDMFLS